MISTTFGVGAFLLMLFFAAHLLLNLWVTSVIDDVATTAALEVARAPDGSQRSAVERQARTRALASLGEVGSRVVLDFDSDPSTDAVIVRVRAPSLRLLPRGFADPLGLGGIDRQVVIASERSR